MLLSPQPSFEFVKHLCSEAGLLTSEIRATGLTEDLWSLIAGNI